MDKDDHSDRRSISSSPSASSVRSRLMSLRKRTSSSPAAVVALPEPKSTSCKKSSRKSTNSSKSSDGHRTKKRKKSSLKPIEEETSVGEVSVAVAAGMPSLDSSPLQSLVSPMVSPPPPPPSSSPPTPEDAPRSSTPPLTTSITMPNVSGISIYRSTSLSTLSSRGSSSPVRPLPYTEPEDEDEAETQEANVDQPSNHSAVVELPKGSSHESPTAKFSSESSKASENEFANGSDRLPGRDLLNDISVSNSPCSFHNCDEIELSSTFDDFEETIDFVESAECPVQTTSELEIVVKDPLELDDSLKSLDYVVSLIDDDGEMSELERTEALQNVGTSAELLNKNNEFLQVIDLGSEEKTSNTINNIVDRPLNTNECSEVIDLDTVECTSDVDLVSKIQSVGCHCSLLKSFFETLISEIRSLKKKKNHVVKKSKIIKKTPRKDKLRMRELFKKKMSDCSLNLNKPIEKPSVTENSQDHGDKPDDTTSNDSGVRKIGVQNGLLIISAGRGLLDRSTLESPTTENNESVGVHSTAYNPQSSHEDGFSEGESSSWEFNNVTDSPEKSMKPSPVELPEVKSNITQAVKELNSVEQAQEVPGCVIEDSREEHTKSDSSPLISRKKMKKKKKKKSHSLKTTESIGKKESISVSKSKVSQKSKIKKKKKEKNLDDLFTVEDMVITPVETSKPEAKESESPVTTTELPGNPILEESNKNMLIFEPYRKPVSDPKTGLITDYSLEEGTVFGEALHGINILVDAGLKEIRSLRFRNLHKKPVPILKKSAPNLVTKYKRIQSELRAMETRQLTQLPTNEMVSKFLSPLCRQYFFKGFCGRNKCILSHTITNGWFTQASEEDAWNMVCYIFKNGDCPPIAFIISVLGWISQTPDSILKILSLFKPLYRVKNLDDCKTGWSCLVSALVKAGYHRYDAVRLIFYSCAGCPLNYSIADRLFQYIDMNFESSFAAVGYFLQPSDGYILPGHVLKDVIEDLNNFPPRKTPNYRSIILGQVLRTPLQTLLLYEDTINKFLECHFTHPYDINREHGHVAIAIKSRLAEAKFISTLPPKFDAGGMLDSRGHAHSHSEDLDLSFPKDKVHEIEKYEAAIDRAHNTNNLDSIFKIILKIESSDKCDRILLHLFVAMSESETINDSFSYLEVLFQRCSSLSRVQKYSLKGHVARLSVTCFIHNVRNSRWFDAYRVLELIRKNRFNPIFTKPLTEGHSEVAVAVLCAHTCFINDHFNSATGILIENNLLTDNYKEWIPKGNPKEFSLIRKTVQALFNAMKTKKVIEPAATLFKKVVDVQNSLYTPIDVGKHYGWILQEMCEVPSNYRDTPLRLYSRVSEVVSNHHLSGTIYRTLLNMTFATSFPNIEVTKNDLFIKCVEAGAFPPFEDDPKTLTVHTCMNLFEYNLYLKFWFASLLKKLKQQNTTTVDHHLCIVFQEKSAPELGPESSLPPIISDLDCSYKSAMKRFRNALSNYVTMRITHMNISKVKRGLFTMPQETVNKFLLAALNKKFLQEK